MATIFFLLLVGVLSGISSAQTTPSRGPVDLTAPTLQVHTSLAQNNLPTFPRDLLTMLAEAEVTAAEKGIVTNGLDLVSDDLTAVMSPSDVLTMYQKLACEADAIVVGHTGVWIHHLAASRTQIYTDYDFTVDTIVKNDRASALVTTKHIVVTRPGGSLQLGAGKLNTVDVRPGSYPHFQTNATHLIFLHRIPASGGYEALGSAATFVANHGQWTIANTAMSYVTLPDFTRAVLETRIADWLTSCK